MARILCVDDDRYLTDLLRYGLTHAGFEVTTAATGREGLRLARAGPVDLVILDVNMPDMNGFAVLAALRAFSTIPVIMLTARNKDEDVIAGIDGGADDYVAKPFSMQVLVTRVEAVLRRGAAPAAPAAPADDRVYEIAGAILEPETNDLVAADGTRVRLTPTESRILQLLLAREGQALSGERIMSSIWGDTNDSNIGVVKTHVRHLREKIERLPGHQRPIHTLSGIGYMVRSRDATGWEESQTNAPGSTTPA